MNITHIVMEDITGGAGRAAYRLNKSLNKINVKSRMLVTKKSSSDPTIKSIRENKIKKIEGIVKLKINDLYKIRYSPSTIFSNNLLGSNIIDDSFIKEADLINLHWVNMATISYNQLNLLSKLSKPIIWTLHDMWPFTGGCHYDEECGRYKTNCGNCKVLKSNKERDLSTKIQKKKEKIYLDMNITIVGCSNWITECAKESKVFKNKLCINIPNCIDIETFKPVDKEVARNILNIKTNKKIILFGAMSSTSDARKGFKYMLDTMKILDKDKYIAVIFGNSSEESEIQKYIETIYMGQLSDDYTLALLYNASDVFVAPSIQENLANTVMESLSCGTPVVAFNIGGMPDMIKHEINGYLCEPFKYESLGDGIEYCAKNTVQLGENARKYVEDNYTYEIIGKKYTNLYEKLLETKE